MIPLIVSIFKFAFYHPLRNHFICPFHKPVARDAFILKNPVFTPAQSLKLNMHQSFMEKIPEVNFEGENTVATTAGQGPCLFCLYDR